MGDAIKHCFANLTNFDGEDNRPTFWWWVLFVFLVTFAISFASSMVFAVSSMGGAIMSAVDGANEAQVETEMLQAMASGMATQAWIGAGISVLGLGLILAAFGRRLRDARLPVLLVVIPVITTLWGAYISIELTSEMAELMATGDMQAIEEQTLSSAGAGLVTYVGYLVILVGGLIPTRQ